MTFLSLLCTARTSEHCQEHLNKEELATSVDTSLPEQYFYFPTVQTLHFVCRWHFNTAQSAMNNSFVQIMTQKLPVTFNSSVLHLTNVLFLYFFSISKLTCSQIKGQCVTGLKNYFCINWRRFTQCRVFCLLAVSVLLCASSVIHICNWQRKLNALKTT